MLENLSNFAGVGPSEPLAMMAALILVFKPKWFELAVLINESVTPRTACGVTGVLGQLKR